MSSDSHDRLTRWLANHDDDIARFREPIPLTTVDEETTLSPDAIRAVLTSSANPVHHAWPHEYRGKTRRSKPYCLRLNGPDTVGLDWEYSVVSAVEAEFQRRGYEMAQELGTPQHIEHLAAEPRLTNLEPGINLRDLWALRRIGNRVDLWIIEAKGKESAEFDYYCFAEVLGQVFEIPAAPMTDLLGTRRRASHGLCWIMANRLLEVWRAKGLTPIITVAVLVPYWTPDVVWKGGKTTISAKSYYARPMAAFRRFLTTGQTKAQSGRYKYERAFGQVLEHLESAYAIRELSEASNGLRFRVLAARTDVSDGQFHVDCLDPFDASDQTLPLP